MTYEEALKIAKGKMFELVLEAEIATEKRKKRINEECAMLTTACAAMEKQIQLKVTDVHVDEYYCPSCGAENNCNNKVVEDKYCSECGQALKGSEEI